MQNHDTSAVGVQPRQLQSKDTRELLELRRELEAALAVCDFAVRSYDPDEHRAAVRIVKGDMRRCCK